MSKVHKKISPLPTATSDKERERERNGILKKKRKWIERKKEILKLGQRTIERNVNL